ncbi:MAG: hypothetical protein ACYTGH_06680 [Planctomycetota bacterium]|jgi:hypothetical protein
MHYHYGNKDEWNGFTRYSLPLFGREAYRAPSGTIETIVKPGGLHHPHGLEDPTPIVDFIRGRPRD